MTTTTMAVDAKSAAQLESQGILSDRHPAYRTFTPTVACLAACILAFFLAFVQYEHPEGTAAQVGQYYKWLLDVEVMIFVGFGFLMTFLRRYGYSAVGFNFFTSALIMLEAVLLIGAVQQGLGKGWPSIRLELPLVIDATFCAGAGMIAFGAVLGKTTPTQLTWIMVGMVPLYALNQHLVFKVLQGLDMGGSITIHAFGAYYGLAASLMLSNGRQAPGAYTSANIKNSATYTSDLFSMIGTIFLWMYWPSFNGALASIEASALHEANPDNILLPQQYYCVVNTLFSLLGSVLSTFAVSSWLNNGRFDMMHVQNATLAGGVAMGSSAALRLSPGGAVAVGLFAGCLSTFGFGWLAGVLEQKLNLGDTCGVHNLHGMPGLLGGFIAGIAAFGQAADVAPHGSAQLGFQILSLLCTVAIASTGGALVCALATGRLGINQFKAASARRERKAWAGAADGYNESDAFGVDETNMAAIDGLALFDDSIFWTEVQLETPFSGGPAADLTNYSLRNGSFHARPSGSQHRTNAVFGSSHGGSRHAYASPHGSKHGGVTVPSDTAAANGKDINITQATARAGAGNAGLYGNGVAKAGDQAV